MVSHSITPPPPPGSAPLWSPLSGLNLPHRPCENQASVWVNGNVSWAPRLPRASREPQCLQRWQQFDEFPRCMSSCLSNPTLFCRLLQRSVRQSFRSGIKLVSGRTKVCPPSHIHLTLKPLRTTAKELQFWHIVLHQSAGTAQTTPSLSPLFHSGASQIYTSWREYPSKEYSKLSDWLPSLLSSWGGFPYPNEEALIWSKPVTLTNKWVPFFGYV